MLSVFENGPLPAANAPPAPEEATIRKVAASAIATRTNGALDRRLMILIPVLERSIDAAVSE